MNFTILPKEEIEQLTILMEYIYKHGIGDRNSVASIKEKFHLNSDEYHMAMELTMPVIRAGNGTIKWRSKYVEVIKYLDRVYNSPNVETDPEYLKSCVGYILKIQNEERKKMLSETIHELIDAIREKDKFKKEKLLKTLERAGMDRHSAMTVAKELMAMEEEKKQEPEPECLEEPA